MEKEYKVSGMMCVNCASAVYNAVNKLGVKKAEVSLLEKSLYVEFDENKVSESEIFSAVKNAGYKLHYKSEKVSDIKDIEKRLFLSLILLIPLMYFSMGGMIQLPQPKAFINYSFQTLIATALIIVNRQFFVKGFLGVKNKSPNMETLIALGSTSAYLYSAVSFFVMLFGGEAVSHLFYDSVGMVFTLVSLGKYFEELSKKRTTKEVEKLSKLLPDKITVFIDGEEKIIKANEVKKGDIICLKAGDYATCDGKVVFGQGYVNTSAITGESIPTEVFNGENIKSGSFLENGYIRYIAENVLGDTLFSKIIKSVKNAGRTKAPIQRTADKISAYFVPIVCGVSLITFLCWIIITGNFYLAFKYAIGVLVVSCPCSLGLATPVAVMVALGKGAKNGILYKDARSLQNFRRIDYFLFDKTATLTTGEIQVEDATFFADKEEILPIVYALEQRNNHPLSKALTVFCKDYENDKEVKNFEYLFGKGISGEIDGIKYYLGNDKIIGENTDKSMLKNITGLIRIVLIKESTIKAVFYLADTVKDNSCIVLSELLSMNKQVVMVTGDNKSVANMIAEKVGIDKVECEVLPEDKADIVNKYKAKGIVAMVGDGINDSVALKVADIGVSVGNGTDIAIESADVVLVDGNLDKILTATRLSEKTMTIIKQNLFWAFFYNLILIPLASGIFAFIGLSLSPSICALFMCISSLFVVTNALRINAFNIENKKRRKENGVIRTK